MSLNIIENINNRVFTNNIVRLHMFWKTLILKTKLSLISLYFFYLCIIWSRLIICVYNRILISTISTKTCLMNAVVYFLISMIDTTTEAIDTTIGTTAEMCYNCYISPKGKPPQWDLSIEMSEGISKNNAAKYEK